MNQQQLILYFRNSRYEKTYHAHIYKLITQLCERFPTLIQQTSMVNNAKSIRIEGTVPIFVNQKYYDCPLRIFLPDSFPKNPPQAMLLLKPGSMVATQYVKANGVFDIQRIYTWNAAGATLIGLVENIIKYLNANPPITLESLTVSQNLSLGNPPSNPPSNPSNSQISNSGQIQGQNQDPHVIAQNVPQYPQMSSTQLPNNSQNISGELTNEKILSAQKRLAQLNKELRDAQNQVFYLELFENAKEITSNISSDLSKCCDDLQAELERANSVEVPEYIVPRDIGESAKLKSDSRAYQETLARFKQAFQAGKVPPEEYFASVRRFSQHYFKTTVLPHMK
ncbi:hypothetical protein TRFO_33028 [Tritrichomonas foetus]|uniref:UEV domain-containing protein n=1 Tax=Tritrichomonas foetus TaxID=1144522 RepID=A0A1J4JSX3_9EUKA|nr:hypothetical protein TRFO_33028 [Tritrichomonas foetus]|eukprot:OHT00373.1 hypothetical protein TRFO_33028 [Tritrichomonas foetus]